MKCVAVGDVFITPEMMEIAVEKQPKLIDSCSYFYFGLKNRKGMRDTVKAIERGERDTIAIPAGLEEAVADAECLMVHLCPVTKALIAKAPKLKYILCNRGGVENIDVDAATERGIMVLNNPAHNANAVAEFVIGQIFCELRNIARAHYALKNGVWREKYPNSEKIIELKDLTVGVLGFGSIGELVCEKLSAFGCRMLVNTLAMPEERSPRIAWDRLERVDKDTLLSESDIITIHVRTKEKMVLIGAREFELMKRTAYLINTSRSCYVDSNALFEALSGGQIRGAAIDVFDTEPLGPSYPFLELDNITLTNHRAGDTYNAYGDSPIMMFSALADWLGAAKKPRFWVNRKSFEVRA